MKQVNPEDIQEIFDCWNSFAGRRKERHSDKKWKGHNKISPEIESACKQVLKLYSVDEICQAIKNYAETLLSGNTTWTYAWNLWQFLGRHNPKYRNELQLWRFLPNNYTIEDYLMDEFKQKRAEQQRYTEQRQGYGRKPPTIAQVAKTLPTPIPTSPVCKISEPTTPDKIKEMIERLKNN
jgi:hypothetical protein